MAGARGAHFRGNAYLSLQTGALEGGIMSNQHQLDDLGLAALISSRICHDVISPVGAIANGLEVLDEEDDAQVREYALDLIRKSAAQASAKLQFARLAFGAAGSAGSEIDMNMARDIVLAVLDEAKHQLVWQVEPQTLVKDKAKLLLNLISIAITTLPRGGIINLAIQGTMDRASMTILCRGQGARVPDGLTELISGQSGEALDTLSIQPYYASRIASVAQMRLVAGLQNEDVVLSANPLN